MSSHTDNLKSNSGNTTARTDNLTSRALLLHCPRFPGPTMELGPDGRWQFPNPVILTGSDRMRILQTWFHGLDSIDSALLWRVLEINGDIPTII